MVDLALTLAAFLFLAYVGIAALYWGAIAVVWAAMAIADYFEAPKPPATPPK